MAKRHSEAIVELTKEELQPGLLGKLYQEGAKAVHLQHDDRVEQIWMELVVAQKNDFGKPFWQNGIVDFARNHAAQQMDLGDMWRFLPGNYGHIARKTILYPEPGSQTLKTIPEYFWSGDRLEAPPQEILRVVWELASEVFLSALPAHASDHNYAVVLELLKYPDGLSDLERIFDLLADASGGWAQVGQQIDAYKAMTTGLLDKRGVRDLFALGSMIPPLRPLLHALNRSLGRFNRYDSPDDAYVIGKPHTDTTRALTCLGGDRDRITTEIYDGEKWHELAFTTDSLFIFPADLMSKQLNFEPTIHRYSVKKDLSLPTDPKPNISLMIGIVDQNYFQHLKKYFK